MKKFIALLFVLLAFNSCGESDASSDDMVSEDDDKNDDKTEIYEAPRVLSYVTYISQQSVTLNGFIDYSNIFFQESDAYNVGFIFRSGDENDSSNDQVITLEGEVPYFNGTYNFDHNIDGLEPNTTYYYSAFTKNGSSEKDNWKSFTTSEIPCDHVQDNYYSVSGEWRNATVEITDPLCCSDGNVGFRFGRWPDIYEINFNEQDNGYPKTGQYFGVDYEFDITNIQRELVRSTNQVLMPETDSTPETELFVNNDGKTITIIFCNTTLRNGDVLNGKVSVEIP
jgi:hypothetical protein